MKMKLMLIIVFIQMVAVSCASTIFSRIGYYIAYPFEINPSSTEILDMNCKNEISNNFDEIDSPRYNLSKNFALGGLFADLGIGLYGIYYGIMASMPIIGFSGFVYSIGSIFSWGDEADKFSYDKYKDNNSGWLNTNSRKCKDTHEFFVYKIEFPKEDGAKCDVTDSDIANFYTNLIFKSNLKLNDKEKLQMLIGVPKLYINQGHTSKSLCRLDSLYSLLGREEKIISGYTIKKRTSFSHFIT
jgi:hypothetical protein